MMPVDAAVLPAHLLERVHASDTPLRPGGARVLYWMRTSVRVEENPALDTALVMAEHLGLPLLVYHAVSERYPFANDRHHTFILEGARDVAAACRARGIPYACHVERPGHRGPHLRTLAAAAALVVTERMPTPPLVAWTQRLRQTVATPVWEVDAACVVPVTLVPRAFDRAFAYRDATASVRRDRLSRDWPAVSVAVPDTLPPLPFEPVAIETADLASLVGACAIDHSVAPVAHTRGGTRAGMARWEQFVGSGGLAHYAATRNDARQLAGVSRMSPYLHYGMVSPLRLAREAAARRGEGPAKWLDELLVWRELAYAWCHHVAGPYDTRALPGWARTTLQQHAGDARAPRSWETLARSGSGDRLWDAMQHSLRVHGELHNNVRMTWGKALPFWTRDAAEALRLLFDLNDRYALDGRDPSSVGGILWCLGQFDRPFAPEGPVLGSVRSRPLAHHAHRLRVAEYEAVVHRPVARATRVAVIGAGVAGLHAARVLQDHGVTVQVFEKSRGLGGRTATRRTPFATFDHGAQYLTIRDPRLQRACESWVADGVLAPWTGRIAVWEPARGLKESGSRVARYVAVPGMTGLARHLARDLGITVECRITALEGGPGAWRLRDAEGRTHGPFEAVVVALPAAQAAPLLAPHAPAMAKQAAAVTWGPVWATMLVAEQPPALPWDAAFVNEHPVLTWVTREGSKPGRTTTPAWTLHASPAWTRAHLEDDAGTVASAMIEAFSALVGARIPVVDATAHRWRYAIPESTPDTPGEVLVDAQAQLIACGDWCAGSRVEGALLSGAAAAGAWLRQVHAGEPVA